MLSLHHDQGEELPPDVHPAIEESNQIVEALLHIDRDPRTLVRWPYPDLDALTGPMGPGEVWFTAAFSGGGKTTFVVSTIEMWRQQGYKIYVMPLELSPKAFRITLACLQTGTRPGDALGGALALDPSREAERERLRAAVRAQVKPEFSKHIRFDPQESINLRGLHDGLKRAKQWGADIVVIDHIDHIESDDESAKTNLYAESVRVNNAALKLARRNDMLLWFTSQLNMEVAKRDHVAKFGPPMEHHLMYPTAKIKNATGIIGLYRPLRQRRPDEDEKGFAELLRARMRGDGDVTDILEPNTVGVTAMKLRNMGQNAGKKILLGFDRGRVIPLAEKDRYQTGFGGRIHEVYGGK